MKYHIPYHKREINFYLPDQCLVDQYLPVHVEAHFDPIAEVNHSLNFPVDQIRLEEYTGIRTAAIAINDITRPVPHHQLLPPVLNRLTEMGVKPENIKIIIATGTHTPHHLKDIKKILPEDIIEGYTIISHDSDDQPNLVYLGKTTRETPVYANRFFMESDLRIVCGNIEPHHFAGFSGGSKTAAIGLAGRLTITKNHEWLLHPNSIPGEFDHNPVRMDIEEIGKMMDIHYGINALLNNERQIVQVISGSPLAMIKAGIPIIRKLSQTPVQHLYDIVIASPGGYPKDINFYQAQKAITHATLINRQGGVVILVAACKDGIGSESYKKFMVGLNSHQEVLDKFQAQGFQIGPHKAVQIAMRARNHRFILISEMGKNDVNSLLLEYAHSIEDAVEMAMSVTNTLPTIAILPKATNTMPVVSLKKDI